MLLAVKAFGFSWADHFGRRPSHSDQLLERRFMPHVTLEILQSKTLPQQKIVLELIGRIIPQSLAGRSSDRRFADVNVQLSDLIEQEETENRISLHVLAPVLIIGGPFAAARAHKIVQLRLFLCRYKVFAADRLPVERAQIDFAHPTAASA